MFGVFLILNKLFSFWGFFFFCLANNSYRDLNRNVSGRWFILKIMLTVVWYFCKMYLLSCAFPLLCMQFVRVTGLTRIIFPCTSPRLILHQADCFCTNAGGCTTPQANGACGYAHVSDHTREKINLTHYHRAFVTIQKFTI